MADFTFTANAAPGAPGIAPRWTSSAKSGIGTSATESSRLWFTLSHGIVNEVYYPRLDQANIRDLGLVITAADGFFSEEKRSTQTTTRMVASGVPAYEITNDCLVGRYHLRKTVLSDPRLPTLLQQVHFEARTGRLEDYVLHALLAPHLQNRGADNDGWVETYKGQPMLFAQRDGTTLALACSAPWLALSCGYVGSSDGWSDLRRHHRLTHTYREARQGNIALIGEVDLPACRGDFTLALAFGRNPAEAGQRARSSLQEPFQHLLHRYVVEWRSYQRRCVSLASPRRGTTDLYRVSTAVLKTHLAKETVGGLIASLSIPWGFSKGDNDLGGYHLVWPRDQVETAGALLAAGDTDGVRDVLRFLLATQEADGHWPQNMWIDGSPYWNGLQLDETAFPILLADALHRAGALRYLAVWPAVRLAAAYIVRNGPTTMQDRWEENGGYSPFTLAVVIAGLLAAADFADAADEPAIADYLRETADGWNAQIETWTYVTATPLAERLGVEGYYVRIAPPEVADAASPTDGFVPIKNRPADDSGLPTTQLVSPDALALVRFGLRRPDDPRILNTLRVVDALLKSDTETGPVWHRYNDDGYGEHADGSPFDGTGIGRGWPLLAGERAHYELAAGRIDEAEALRRTMEAQTGDGGFLPEQVWDDTSRPELELYNGHPAGSAMPLVWAHAEYIKLLRSLRDGRVFDLPPQTVARYAQAAEPRQPDHVVWRFAQRRVSRPAGRNLRLELLAPATVHWSTDDWSTVHDSPTRDTGLGLHVADLPVADLPPDRVVRFTFRWYEVNRWEGIDFAVAGTAAQSS